MPKNFPQRPWFLGVVLICIGTLFILDEIGIFRFSWPLILIVIGIAIFAGAGTGRRRDSVFPSSLLILLGFSFLIQQSHLFYWGFADGWPLYMLSVGLAFIFAYLAQTHKGTGLLIPGGILTVLGTLFLLAENRIIDWHGLWHVFNWWPVVLIALGIWLLVRKNPVKNEDKKDADVENRYGKADDKNEQ